jgi:hypothetical protein
MDCFVASLLAMTVTCPWLFEIVESRFGAAGDDDSMAVQPTRRFQELKAATNLSCGCQHSVR